MSGLRLPSAFKLAGRASEVSMAVPTFHAIVVVDIESFGPRTPPRTQARVELAGQRGGIVSSGPTTVHGDQVAGDKIVRSR
jgi:hypothetical protein